MLKEFTDEATFVSEMVEIPDAQCLIAKELHDKFGNYGPVILRNDKKSLCFAISEDKRRNSNRLETEKGNNLYRITIEKI